MLPSLCHLSNISCPTSKFQFACPLPWISCLLYFGFVKNIFIITNSVEKCFDVCYAIGFRNICINILKLTVHWKYLLPKLVYCSKLLAVKQLVMTADSFKLIISTAAFLSSSYGCLMTALKQLISAAAFLRVSLFFLRVSL